MCYSTALRKEREKVEQRLLNQSGVKIETPNEYNPYFHLNGFTHGNLYIIKMDEHDKIYPASWGLIPDWASHNSVEFRKKSNTLNARSESIFEKASFKNSANEKRCLILADGFYEPHHENGIALPYFCFQPTEEFPEGDLFLFAGLYNELDEELTTTILTVEANDFFSEVHNKKKRMPLVLDDSVLEDWFDDGMNQSQINELMAFGFSTKKFKAHQVSRDLYKKGVNTNRPYIVEKVTKQTLF
ncbi:SOS response-associated peptidase [Hyunsoonleella aestuarii]|uniref:Abasic site processing protein n=1 Tax=Hyunsoonleella aestuarii TaxID=912802 RepID=A0ABP8E9E2_9FLAO|nr:SOS response-associated peptidase [Hyunsoonleella aestuarii]